MKRKRRRRRILVWESFVKSRRCESDPTLELFNPLSQTSKDKQVVAEHHRDVRFPASPIRNRLQHSLRSSILALAMSGGGESCLSYYERG